MFAHPSNPRSLITIPVETTDAILTTLLRTVLPTYDDGISLWSISPTQSGRIARATFQNWFRLRLVCPDFDHHILDLGLAWSVLPLAQMDSEDLRRAITRSQERPLTVLVTDPDSIGLFWPLLQAASHRIRTLYIDLQAELIGTVSTSLQFCQLPQLRNLFLGARGVSLSREDMGSLAGMIGGWPANGLGMGPSGAQWDGDSMSRRPTQASHTQDLSRLLHIPVTFLCVRHSSFPFAHFQPPPCLVTLHLHKSQGDLYPLNLPLHHFDRALRFMPYLSALELWEVDVIVSTTVDPLPVPSLRSVAIRGTGHSVSTIAQYLRLCALDALVTELVHHRAVDSADLSAHALAISRSLVMHNDVSSVGLFLTVRGRGPWNATIDLVLKTSRDAYLSIRIPAIHAHVFTALLFDCVSASPDARLSFDMSEADDPGNMVHRLFSEFLPLVLFRHYHLCVQAKHVPIILQALEPLCPDVSGRLIVFHGKHQSAAHLCSASTHSRWRRIIGVVNEDDTCDHVRVGRSGRWVGADNKEVFSPSVDLTHDHLMRMLVNRA